VPAEAEAAAYDHFDEQVIGSGGGANAYAEVEFPVFAQVQIQAGDELLFLIA
jgi:hypothetical protein